jgi:hypothetical protein
MICSNRFCATPPKALTIIPRITSKKRARRATVLRWPSPGSSRKTSTSSFRTAFSHVSGRTKKQEDQEGLQILHRGIATRSFERTFRLADYIRVDEADLRDGLLTVSLTRVIPEEKKPRLIPIKDNAVEKAIESKTNSKKV